MLAMRPLRLDSHVHYDEPVPPTPPETPKLERQVSRSAWAGELNQILVDSGDRKNVLARKAGVDARTVSRWLQGELNVSEASVRAVAEAYELNPLEVLVRVGYYRKDEVLTESFALLATMAEAKGDDVIKMIMSAPVSLDGKRRMLEYLAKTRAEKEQQTREAIEQMIEMAGGG